MVVSYDDKRVWKNIDAELKDDVLLGVVANLECLICSEVMHVPFLAQCGHSFCYGCLNSWFETKVNCPTCRMDMEQPPLLNIQLREISKNITDIIIDSLEDDLHQKELRDARQTVIDEYEQDNRQKRLFGEAFNNAPTLVDKSDGVPRCGNCHWEAHGSVCLHCGARFRIPRSDLYFDSDDGDAYNEDHEEVELSGIADDTYDSQDSFVDNREIADIDRDRNNADDDDLLSSGESNSEPWEGFRHDVDTWRAEYENELVQSGSQSSLSVRSYSVGSHEDMEEAIDRLHSQDVGGYIDLSAEEMSGVDSDVYSSDREVGRSRRPVVLDLDSD